MENHRTTAEPAGETGWECHPPSSPTVMPTCVPTMAISPLPTAALPSHSEGVGEGRAPGDALKRKNKSVLVSLFSAVQQTLLEK